MTDSLLDVSENSLQVDLTQPFHCMDLPAQNPYDEVET
jgi:hypothetical protein